MAAMAHLETIIAKARKGEAGSKGSVPGKLACVSFDYYTARPAIEIPYTEADGTKTTLIQTVANPKIAGDMQLHTHVTTPNVVVCGDGSIGGMDMLAYDRCSDRRTERSRPSPVGVRRCGRRSGVPAPAYG
jgi:hypothetical protein